MSVPEPTTALRRNAHQTLSSLPEPLVDLGRLLQRFLQFVAFWLAALLPLAYLPLFATKTVTDPYVFVGALALNAVAVVFGHAHNQHRP